MSLKVFQRVVCSFTAVLGWSILLFSSPVLSLSALSADLTDEPLVGGTKDANGLDYRLEQTKITSGYDGRQCWVHPRPGIIPPNTKANPSETPIVVVTLNLLTLNGMDVYYATNSYRTDDLGKAWIGPTVHQQPMGRRHEQGPNGIEFEVVPCDFWPIWHNKTGVLLGYGHNVRYKLNDPQWERWPYHPREVNSTYSIYDPKTNEWSPRQWIEYPKIPEFLNPNAGPGITGVSCGSAQRYDLPNGDILLPVSMVKHGPPAWFSVTVAKCRFDGGRITYLEHGNTLETTEFNGFCEPSIARFADQYFLTLRNLARGCVTRSNDGLRFDEPIPWTFDDGTPLGNHNTQQHWVTHSDALFLVYTRKTETNHNVYCNRAPLFMAQVDPEKLCVIRETERILVPNRGARLGNFGIVNLSPTETWITTAEWMQPVGKNEEYGDIIADEETRRYACEKYGSNNTVWCVKLHWNRPNHHSDLAWAREGE